MTSVAQYFEQSELALAAYAKNLFFGISGEAFRTALKDSGDGMSSQQAAQFSDNWLVIDQYNDPSSGLSATIFQLKGTDGNPTGPKYLAIRGTEPAANDLTADGLLALGLPASLNPQFTALKAKLDNEWLAAGGPLHNQTFTVTGHSLGGYLAAAVKEQYGSQVSDAYLYNAPGVAGPMGNIFSLIGLSGTPSTNVWNITASEGASIISGLGAPVGTTVKIQIEAAPGVGVGNHSIVRLTDALAVQALYSTLAPSLTQAQLNSLVDASGNPMNQTLESALDALRKLLLGPTVAATSTDDRNSFYTNLYALQGNPAYTSLAGHAQITVLSFLTASSIKGLADSDTAQGLATRFALQSLNPFALVGIDYTTLNVNDALNLYDAAHPDGMTAQYLEDRSTMLQYWLQANTEEKTTLTGVTSSGLPNTDKLMLTDAVTTQTVSVLSDFADDGSKMIRHISFGSDAGETLSGDPSDIMPDHLYGMGGDDTLTGNRGDDYLEGGTGNDTYIINAGGGNDTIFDSDGNGRIQIAGVTIDGGDAIAPGMWKKDGISYSFTPDANGRGRLFITSSVGYTTVQNFANKQLGINLAGAPSPIDPATTLTITGDIAPTDIDPAKAGIQAAADANGNPIGTAGAYADILLGTGGNDHILSGASDDNVGGGAGDDWIEAGAGNDYVNGHADNDLIEGGAGADILAGDAGNDRIYGNVKIDTAAAIANGNADSATGLKGDWLSGNAGDDTLIAGADNDVLAGGGGNDLLIAGAGDDIILGDSDYTPQFILETTPRYSTGSTDWYHTSSAPFNWNATTQADGSILFAPVVGATDPADSGSDIIYAGSGNDRVWAGGGNDVVYGEAGNDVLLGEAGNDVLLGGAGDDEIIGDASYVPQNLQGNDYIDGGDGNDTLWGGGGNDQLFGGAGDDKLYGESGSDYLDGEDGNDILNSGGPGSELFGGAGDDNLMAVGGGNYLDGGDGTDTLAADGGNNTLFGGAGDDIFVINGGGVKRITDAGGMDTLYISGVNFNQVHLRLGSLMIDTGTPGNEIHIDDFNPDDPLGSGSIESFQFDPSTGSGQVETYTYQQLLAKGFEIDGTAGAETLTGTGVDDRITGGAGDDVLMGGAGNDRYSYALGDGNDIIVDTQGSNTLVFGAGIAAANLGVGVDTASGHLYLDTGTGRIDIGIATAASVQQIEFADGKVQSLDYFLQQHPLPINGTACNDTGTARNDCRQRPHIFNPKRILTCRRIGCYRSSFMPYDRNVTTNTEWRIAA